MEKLPCFLNGKLVEMIRKEFFYCKKKLFYSVYCFETVYLPSILEADAYISIFISGVSATGSYMQYCIHNWSCSNLLCGFYPGSSQAMNGLRIHSFLP